MAGRILGGSCGNVRLFSVPSSSSSSSSLSLSLSSFPRPVSRSSSFPLWRSPPFFSIWTGSIRSSLTSTSLRSHLAPFARSSSSSRLAAFGYYLGHRGHPPRCTRYVVCPIFTHGKSTLKRRWTPVYSSSLSSPSTHRYTLFFSILYRGCFSINADRVKIGSQRDRMQEDSFFGGLAKS